MSIFNNTKNSLCFLKIQTTGLDPEKDRIIELSITNIKPESDRTTSSTINFNPERIYAESILKYSNLSNEFLASCPTFKDKSHEIFNYFNNCNFVGFNIKDFDLKFLFHEFDRCGYFLDVGDRLVIDLLQLEQRIFPRGFKEIAKRYLFEGDNKKGSVSKPDLELKDHYSSEETTQLYIHLLQSMIGQHQNKIIDGIPLNYDLYNVDQICSGSKKYLDIDGFLFKNSEGKIFFNFGKYRNQEVGIIAQNNIGYINYLLESKDISHSFKKVLEKLIK